MELDLISKALAAIDSAAKGLWPKAQLRLFGSQVGSLFGSQVARVLLESTCMDILQSH